MIKLIGIPFDANSSFLQGPSLAPPRIRLMEKDGSANCFSENGLEISENLIYKDYGDIHFEDTVPEKAFHKIENTVTNLLEDGGKILSIGGDHSITYPIISAFLKKYHHLNILHLDAHADLYEDFEGNPYSHASPFARIMETGKVASLTQVGIRTFNTHQREQAKKYQINVIEMKDFSFDFYTN